METEIARIIRELDDIGGVEAAIESGSLQMRIARRALERKLKKDRGETVVVGENFFARSDGEATDYGEVFTSNPASAQLIKDRVKNLRKTRDNAAVEAALQRLEVAARTDDQNVMPLLIDCCHAYATVGEMVARLKAAWGEFREPIAL
jgi:methylmalonyl-CoA mutase N-terminal domain/subunit